MLLAVEDGMVNGNVDLADVLFLAATILAVVAAILYAMATRPVTHTTNDGHVHGTHPSVWAPFAGWLAVACFALGWFVL